MLKMRWQCERGEEMKETFYLLEREREREREIEGERQEAISGL